MRNIVSKIKCTFKACVFMTLGVAVIQQCLSADSNMQKDTGFNDYIDSCASCHGADGRGNGPMSDRLIHRPKNLTLLSRENGGSFPETVIYQIIDGRRINLSHGSSDMPVWGRRFRVIEGNEFAVNERISRIIKYIESIQIK